LKVIKTRILISEAGVELAFFCFKTEYGAITQPLYLTFIAEYI